MFICKDCNRKYKIKPDYCDCGNNVFDCIEETSSKKLSLQQKSDIISKIFFLVCIALSVIIWLIPIKTDNTNTSIEKKIINKNIPDIETFWNSTPIYVPKEEPLQEPIKLTPIPANYSKKEPINKSSNINKNPKKTSNIETNSKKSDVNKKIDANKTKIAPKEDKKIVQNKSVENKIVNKPVEPKKDEKKELPDQKLKYNPNSPSMLTYKGNLRAALFSKLATGSITGTGTCSVKFSVDKTGKLINRDFSQLSDNKSLNDAVYYMLMSVPKFNPPPSDYNGETISMTFKFNNGYYEISIK